MPLSRRKFIKRFLLIGTGAVLADAFFIEKFFIETKEFYVGNATKETPNIKVVQVSDLHLQKVNYQLKQLAKRINKLNPHLIGFTGDAVDKAENLEVLSSFLQLLDKNIKKVAILGNWEYWGGINIEALKNIYTNNNCTLLVNESQQFTFDDKTISITGVDDFVGGAANIEAALKNYTPANHHIILNHCPQYSNAITQYLKNGIKADCILSGHTHGGQINILGFIPFLPQGSGKYIKGWYNTQPKMYVSKGIGTSIFPARFGARAEIAIFNLG